jgi:hypothetical protein
MARNLGISRISTPGKSRKVGSESQTGREFQNFSDPVVLIIGANGRSG